MKEVWRLAPPEDAKTPAAWEGAPLVSGRRLWAVYAKFEAGRTVHVAVCYDPADIGKTLVRSVWTGGWAGRLIEDIKDAGYAPGRPAWTAELCDGAQSGERTRQELLTLAGRNLVFCSNSGAVVAVDAVTGRRAWAFRYPRSRKATSSATGDPAPAVAFGGRVFVAPADGERVYALDAETGKLVWESGTTEGARVLGVARGRLVVTVTGPQRGIRGLNLDTGSYRDDGGWAQHTDILSYGHGLVTDDTIVWPSREGLFFLDARTGRPERHPLYNPDGHRGYFGHVAYADGVLVVVTPTHVRGYVAESRKIVPRPDAAPARGSAGSSIARRANSRPAKRPAR